MSDSLGTYCIAEVPGKDGRTRYYLSPLAIEKVFSIGLRPEAIIGEVSNPHDISPSSFKPNPIFVQFLYHVLVKHAKNCRGLVAEAKRTRNGYVYLIDKRTPTPDDAVPPEDIIGGFEVKEGRFVRFHGSPRHQLVSDRGLFQLDSFYHARLVEELEALPPAG